MYLSNRDIKWAIEQGLLFVRPSPDELNAGYDETSIDLHLDNIEKGARVWNIDEFKRGTAAQGILSPELYLGTFDYRQFAGKFLKPIPDLKDSDKKVFKRGDQVIVRPQGFLLWTTVEMVGTPEENPQFICFVNAKSTKARTGLVVHLSAPTIHAGWKGNITLEIVNFGPFDFILQEGDSIAQLTVAKITSSTDLSLKKEKSKTNLQTDPSGTATGS